MQRSISLHPFALAAALALPASAQSLLLQHGEVVQALGDPVPGLPGVVVSPTISLFLDSPTIDLDGNVMYRAKLEGAGVTTDNDRAYLMGRGADDLEVAVRKGDPAPGCPGDALVLDWLWPRVSPRNGLLFFPSAVTGVATAANDLALFWGPGGGTLLAREGSPVPFVAGATWAGFEFNSGAYTRMHICETGAVLITASIAGAGVNTANDAVLVTGVPGALQPVVREGQVYPGGAVAQNVGVGLLGSTTSLNGVGQLNATGQVLHDLKFVNGVGGVTANDDRALAVWTAGVDTILAREGDPAPGLPAGVVFADPSGGVFYELTPCSFNRLGQVAFTARLAGPGVTAANDTAAYVGGVGGLTLLLREGDAVPGLPGVTWGDNQGRSMQLNNDGDVAFISALGGVGVTGANETSMWIRRAGALSMIAREGALNPASGIAFSHMESGNKTGNPYLSDRGAVLFANGNHWFGYTPEHGVRTVIAPNEVFGPVPWTIAEFFGPTGSSDGTPGWFNANGDFVLRLQASFSGPAAIVRGHLGSMMASPAAISAVAGGTQSWAIDGGAAQASRIYVVLASASGTRPGFPSPLGPQGIPLNIDVWTQLSLDLAGSVVYPGSIGVTNAMGAASGAFALPPAILGPVDLHHAAVLLDFQLASTFVSEPAALRVY